MAVIRALQQVPGALARNPIIFVVFGLLGFVQVPQLLAQALSPLLAGLLSLVLTGVLIVVAPFVQAGATKMADEALDGKSSFGTFFAAGKEYYLSVLGAYLAVFGVSFALGVIGFLVAIFGGVLAVGTGPEFGTAGVAAIALIVLVLVLLYLVFAFLVQFYMQEIVLNEASAIEGLKRSAGLVRRNVVSTLGYFVLVLVGSLGFGLMYGVVSVFLLPTGTTAATMATPSITAMLLNAVVLVVGTAVLGSVFLVYAVSFWRELRGRDGSAEPTDPVRT